MPQLSLEKRHYFCSFVHIHYVALFKSHDFILCFSLSSFTPCTGCPSRRGAGEGRINVAWATVNLMLCDVLVVLSGRPVH